MKYKEIKENLDQLIAQAEAEPQAPTAAQKVGSVAKGATNFAGGLASGIAQGITTGLGGGGNSFYTPVAPKNGSFNKGSASADQNTITAIKQAAAKEPVNPTGNSGLDQLLKNAGLIK